MTFFASNKHWKILSKQCLRTRSLQCLIIRQWEFRSGMWKLFSWPLQPNEEDDFRVSGRKQTFLCATQWWWLLPTSPFQWQETGDCISKGRRRKFQCQCQEIGDCIYERSNVNIRKLEIVKDDAASKFYLSINLVQFGYCLSTLPSKAPMNGVWSVSMSMSGSWR